MSIVNPQSPRPFRSGRSLFFFAVLGAAAAALVFGLPRHIAYAVEKGRLDAMQEHLASVESISSVYRLVAARTRNSVVSIRVEKAVADGTDGDSDLLRDFLRRRMQQPSAKRHTFGSGSGVVLDTDGYIITNNHMVQDAENVTVHLNDGRTAPAKVMARDPKTDLAVVKIDLGNLFPIPLGNSDELQVGDRVLAIGNPFNYESTVTEGIVSALGRANVGIIDGGQGYEDFIQTDAAINPGNSGGALVNMKGELVGINTAIATETGAYSGVAFAIPVNLMKQVSERLKQGQAIRRGWLGVGIENADTAGQDGARIASIYPRTPAALGGLLTGDVVREIEGQPVKTSNDLRNRVAKFEPGSKVTMLVQRGDKTQTLTITLGEQPDDLRAFASARGKEQPDAEPQADGDAVAAKLGLSLEPLTPTLARKLKLTSKTGVVVTAVTADSPASALGIRAGDVIETVNGQPVTTPAAFTDLVNQTPLSEGLRLFLRGPGGQGRYLYLQAE